MEGFTTSTVNFEGSHCIFVVLYAKPGSLIKSSTIFLIKNVDFVQKSEPHHCYISVKVITEAMPDTVLWKTVFVGMEITKSKDQESRKNFIAL